MKNWGRKNSEILTPFIQRWFGKKFSDLLFSGERIPPPLPPPPPANISRKIIFRRGRGLKLMSSPRQRHIGRHVSHSTHTVNNYHTISFKKFEMKKRVKNPNPALHGITEYLRWNTIVAGTLRDYFSISYTPYVLAYHFNIAMKTRSISDDFFLTSFSTVYV